MSMVRSFKLRITQRHVRVVMAESARDLEDEAFDAVMRASAPLMAWVASRATGSMRAISVDLRAAVIRGTFDRVGAGVGVFRVDAEEFEVHVRPACAAIVSAIADQLARPHDRR